MDRDHRRRHGSSTSSGTSEQRKSSSKKKEFVSHSNRFSREKLSRAAVVSGCGLKEFIEKNRPFMRKGVWEKKITPRSNSQHDNQSPRPMQDSRLNQHDHLNIRYDDHQTRGSLDTRITDFESGRRTSVGSAGMPESSHFSDRHRKDDGYYTGDNREEVPMDIEEAEEEHKHTPVTDDGFMRRDRHASREINHNYVKERYNLNLEPMPELKSENIKQEDGYANIPNSQGSWSPARLPRIGQLENSTYERNLTSPRPNNEFRDGVSRRTHELKNSTYERSITPPRPNTEFRDNVSRRSHEPANSTYERSITPPRHNNEFRDGVSRRSHEARQNSPNRYRDSERPSHEFSENGPRRFHDSRECSPNRSQESEPVQNSDVNHTPMPPENVVKNMNEAIPMSWHCQIYLSGLKCHKGDYCDKLHMYPRENGVVCIDFMSGQCNRKADDCWFQHPGEVANEKEPDDGAPVVVQSMGGLLKYIKKEVSTQPNKYKSKELPKKDSPKKGKGRVNANMVPLGSRKENNNANMVPLGARNEADNYSPLQPRKSTTSLLSYGSNTSQQESFSVSTPRGKSSNNHSYESRSPLDRNNSRSSNRTENSEENKAKSSSRERDLSKTQSNSKNNHPTTVNEVADDGKKKHKKRKRDNSEGDNADHHKKHKKQKSTHESNSEAGVSIDSSASVKSQGKKRKEDEKGLYKAIDKLLDRASTGITGGWEKSSDREKDIKTLLEAVEIPIYVKGKPYKNLEINFRMLFLKFAEVDKDLKGHAFWFRESFPDFSNLPKNHKNDQTCCNKDG